MGKVEQDISKKLGWKLSVIFINSLIKNSTNVRSLNLDTLESKTSQDLRIQKFDVIKESIGFWDQRACTMSDMTTVIVLLFIGNTTHGLVI